MRLNPDYERLMKRSRPATPQDDDRTQGIYSWIISGTICETSLRVVEPDLPIIRVPAEEDPGLSVLYDERLNFGDLGIRAYYRDQYCYIPVEGGMVTLARDGGGMPVVIFSDSRYKMEISLAGDGLETTQKERELFEALAFLVEERNRIIPESWDDIEENWEEGRPEVDDLVTFDEKFESVAGTVDNIEDDIYRILRSPEWPVGVIVYLLESGVNLPEAYLYALGKYDIRTFEPIKI